VTPHALGDSQTSNVTAVDNYAGDSKEAEDASAMTQVIAEFSSQSGQFHEMAFLHVEWNGEAQMENVPWEQVGGTWQGRVVVPKRIGTGALVYARCIGGMLWTPDEVRVPEGAADTVTFYFVAADRIECDVASCSALGANGKPLADARLAWIPKSPWDASMHNTSIRGSESRVRLEGVYSGHFLWSLSALGYAPVSGSDTDLIANEDGEYVVSAVLREGWGARLLFRSRRPRGVDTLRVVAGGNPEQNLLSGDWAELGEGVANSTIYCFLNETMAVKMSPQSANYSGGFLNVQSSSVEGE
jgi:hypothetical protein